MSLKESKLPKIESCPWPGCKRELKVENLLNLNKRYNVVCCESNIYYGMKLSSHTIHGPSAKTELAAIRKWNKGVKKDK